jgi:hypothetical protein
MKINTLISAALAAAWAIAVALPQPAAAVTDEDFNALKDLVTRQGQRIDALEKTHEQDQKTIEQNQKLHEQDQQKIEQLKQQLGETQKSATDAQKTAAEAQQKADATAQAQALRPAPGEGNATHNFTMVGDAEVQFGLVQGQHSGFMLADFAPIFLFRARDNVLFEAGFDVTVQNGSTALQSGQNHDSGTTTAVDLSFAQLDYMFSDYSTFVGGYMLLPLGTYTERGAGWINKIPDNPLPRSVLPDNGAGIQLRGGIPVGQSGQSFTYAAYGVNGPSSVDGTANATTTLSDGSVVPNLDLGSNVGIKSDGTTGNLHGAPAGGGRFGYFIPWKAHYDLELGISGQTGAWNDAGNRLWSGLVLDASLHLGPYVEVKGEEINSWVQTDDIGTYRPHGWWIQAGYKLAGLNLDFPLVNNLELVGRYDTVNSGLGTAADRYTIGYVYYFSNTLLFQGDYEFISSNDPSQNHNQFMFQVAYGF